MSTAVSKSQETKSQLALSSPAQRQENHLPKHILTPSTQPGMTCLLVRCGSLWGPLQEPQSSPWKVPPALQQTRSDTVLMDGRGGRLLSLCRAAGTAAMSWTAPLCPATTVATETEGLGQCHLINDMSKGNRPREGQGPWGCLPSPGWQVRLLPPKTLDGHQRKGLQPHCLLQPQGKGRNAAE